MELLTAIIPSLLLLQVASYELSRDERVITCIDWQDRSFPMANVQLQEGDQNYHICLHTCWNLGYHYMAIKPGCSSTSCVCLENRPQTSRRCNQEHFDDCESMKSIPLYYSVVSEEDHSIMACMPNADADSQLSKFKELYVTSVSQCLDECNKDRPSGKNVNKVLAAIASGCDINGKCGEELKCKCVTTSPSVSLMSSACTEKCDKALKGCRRQKFTALYFTDKNLHSEKVGSESSISLRSVIMIAILTSILVIFILIFAAFVIRSKLKGKPMPFKKNSSSKSDNKGTYTQRPSPPRLTQDKISHPSPLPTRAAPAPPPPPAFNKPFMPTYQNPQNIHAQPQPRSYTPPPQTAAKPLLQPNRNSAPKPNNIYAPPQPKSYTPPSQTAAKPLIQPNRNSAPKPHNIYAPPQPKSYTPPPQTAAKPLMQPNRHSAPKPAFDDDGYVSPSIIKANKFASSPFYSQQRHSPPKAFQDSHLMDSDSRASSFSSIKALFDTPKSVTPVFKPSPLAGGNSGNKSSPLTPKQFSYDNSHLSTPYPPQPAQTSPCYMNTEGFFK